MKTYLIVESGYFPRLSIPKSLYCPGPGTCSFFAISSGSKRKYVIVWLEIFCHFLKKKFTYFSQFQAATLINNATIKSQTSFLKQYFEISVKILCLASSDLNCRTPSYSALPNKSLRLLSYLWELEDGLDKHENLTFSKRPFLLLRNCTYLCYSLV